LGAAREVKQAEASPKNDEVYSKIWRRESGGWERGSIFMAAMDD
jgi:hypothetical protein